MHTRWKMTRVARTCFAFCVLAAAFLVTNAQPPCQIANCPNDTYCAERPDGTTDCRACDVSCVGCNGPTANMCKKCKIGFFKTGELQPCQPCINGFFGDQCVGICHCLNNALCNKTNGHCMGWKCDRGYTGLPECQDLCPTNTFGLDCGYECNCRENDTCSHVNGDCDSGFCHPEWGSAGCQRRLPKLARAPELVRARCNNITLSWNAFHETTDIGQGPIGVYRLYKRQNITDENPSPQWELVYEFVVPQNSPNLPTIYNYSVTSDLIQDEGYSFRVDAIGYEFGKNMSRFSTGTESDVYLNPCTTGIESDTVFEFISIVPTGPTTIQATWGVIVDFASFEYNVTITSQFLGAGGCDDDVGEVQVVGVYGILFTPRIIDGLTPFSRYKINVTAVATTVKLRQTFVAEVLTNPIQPSGIVQNLNVTFITSRLAQFEWDPMPCSERNGAEMSYILTLANNVGARESYLTNMTEYEIDNLIPHTTYRLEVRAQNEFGEGIDRAIIDFYTLEEAPTKVEIIDLDPSHSTVTVTFNPPEFRYGVLTTYSLIFSETSDFKVAKSVTVPATRTSIVAERLKSETLYFFKMAASNSAGYGPYGAVVETTTLETPPPVGNIDLSLLNRTSNCLLLAWTPPDTSQNPITSFVVEIKTASVAGTTVKRDVLDVSVRRHEVCDLAPSTLFEVTVSGNNKDGVVTTATEFISTKNGNPPIPPRPIFVRSTYTNITIAIDPVISPVVPITAYQIQVQNLGPSKRKKRWAALPGQVVAELDPSNVTQNQEFVIGDGQEYGGYLNEELARESLYLIYYVALSTLNGETTASWSQIQESVSTEPFDPDILPPLTINLASKTMTCLTFSWTVPQQSGQLIFGFILNIQQTGENGANIATTRLSQGERVYEQCFLAPFTLYTITLSARSNTDEQLTSASASFTTVHDTPPQPVAPKFVNSSYTTISVSIEPVVPVNGPISSYELYAEVASPGNGRRKRVTGVPGNIVAVFSGDQITEKRDFIVGDGIVYGGVTNQPLRRGIYYTVNYVAVSTASNITKYSYSSLDPAVRTVPYTPPVVEPKVIKEDNDTLIIVIVVLALLFILAIVLLLLYCCWWKRRKNPYEIQEDDKKGMILPPFDDDYDPERYWSTAYNVKDSRHIIAGRNLVYKEGPQAKINEETATNQAFPKVSFADEFHNLPHGSNQATDNEARQHENLNRFPHLLPFDHSLVQLKPDVNSQGTYINASYMPGYKKTPAYIAAQSPYDEDTVLDFWRMIYQKSIKTIVMITNVVEDNIVKCTQYWPDHTKASYGNFLLHLLDTDVYADFTIRIIGIKIEGEETSKTVALFEYTSWPDHGIPDDPIPFLEMRHKVSDYHNDDPSPILVHCGTGVSRTGVFIAVDALIRMYSELGKVMVFDYVRRIRKDRPYMVRTQKQYVFIYEALFEEFHAGNTLVEFDLKQRYHNWTRKNPLTNHTYLRDQFKLLETYTRGLRKDECQAAILEANVHKNRYLDVLPADSYRPVLKSAGGPNSTDYINAVFVDGYLMKNRFIITQTPLQDTIKDFWRLVYDHNVQTIVMVENFKNEDVTCADYWHQESMSRCEPFVIDVIEAYQQDNITIRNFKIWNSANTKAPVRTVRQFQFNAWANPKMTPESKTMMLDLIDDVFAWEDETGNSDKPIIVHCQDGCSHSGLFAILSVLCEKLEKDREVDVYRTIKHIKRRRKTFVRDYDKFVYIYKTVWDFMCLRMTGGLFTDTLGQNKGDKQYGVASLDLRSYGSLNDDATSVI